MSREELPAPVAALFPAPAERTRLDEWLTRALASATARVLRGPVLPDIDMAAFREALAHYDFAEPQPLEALLAWTIGQLEHGVVHMNHPRYFGLFNPPANFPSQCADRISGAFNPQLATSGSSPVPVQIEAHVLRAVARRAGLPPESTGHFTTSGSEANYTALICALTSAQPRFAAEGVRAFGGTPALYTSRACQPAWFKIVRQAGMGLGALRLIDTDGAGRISCEALEQALARDRRAGFVPVMIAATAGTSGAGMIDALGRCADIARAEYLWYHVDAAWGGAAIASERLRGCLGGLERADSVTIDAHKWFSTSMGCGMFLTRAPQTLREAFAVSADFMPSSVAEVDPYLNSVQWSRRFMGLRLFLSLAAAGWSGYAAHVERAVEVIARVAERLRARGWAIVNDSPLAVLCVEPPAGSPPVRQIVRRVLDSGRAWVAVSSFEGRDAVRICATHGEISLGDVGTLADALEAALKN